jgi:hypothetical protein
MLTRRWLLEHGMALAASNYRTPAGVVFAEPAGRPGRPAGLG